MKILRDTDPFRVLFIDVETVPVAPVYDDMPAELKPFWDRKAGQISRDESTPGEMFERAGIYSEFGKIITISAGVLTRAGEGRGLRIKSFYGDNEKLLLEEFAGMVNSFSKGKEALLCAHNGKEFDFPFIARRMLINGLPVPAILDNAGKKPWEINLLDTMELWKFGDYKHYTSLALICTLLGIPTPKDDIDGSQVAGIYYNEGDIKRIALYCEKDVIALTRLFLRLRGDDIVDDSAIESVTGL
ncbi:MAG: 3'-5' exonuclease [Bacteroidales bacterium]|nr:3'-5' exonuclease [Bacteroidales bacterium]